MKSTTARTRAREHYRNDRRAFFTDCLRVKHRDSTVREMVPLNVNPCQEALLRLIERIEEFNLETSRYLRQHDNRVQITHLPVRIIILKPRKEGVSTFVEAFAYHLCEFEPHTNALVMAHRLDGAQNIGAISRRFTQFFPETDPNIKTEMRRNSMSVIAWHEDWDSQMFIVTSKEEAVARGHTFDLMHLSEVAHFETPDAISAAQQACGKYPYVFKESTANGIDHSFYGSWQSAMRFEQVKEYWDAHKMFPPRWNGEYKFFWAWFQDPDYRMPVLPEEAEYLANDLMPEEHELQQHFGVDLGQLKWRRHIITTKCSEQTRMTPEDFFRQEYPAFPEEAFVASGNNVFNRTQLARLEELAKERKPKWHGGIVLTGEGQCLLKKAKSKNISGSPLVIWEDPRRGRSYVVGADAAEGLEHGDYSTCSVWDRTDGTRLVEVARYRGKANARDLGDICAFLGAKYNLAYLIPEANPPGNATCQRLMELKYANVYHRKDEERIGINQDTETFAPGFKTYKNTKRMIIEHAQAILRERDLVICHPDAIREWQIFSNEDGKLTAPVGETDDCVISDALAIYGHRVTAPLVRSNPWDDEDRDNWTPEDILSADVAELVKKKIKKDRKKREKAQRWKQRHRQIGKKSFI